MVDAKLKYLNTIYMLEKNNIEVTVTNIAKQNNVSKAAVTKFLKVLNDSKLIKYLPYGTIELTKEGEKIASKYFEAYDITYIFFKDILNLNEDIARQEAEKAKTIFCDETLNNMAKFVYSELGLNLNCNYDLNKEKCRNCVRKVSNG